VWHVVEGRPVRVHARRRTPSVRFSLRWKIRASSFDADDKEVRPMARISKTSTNAGSGDNGGEITRTKRKSKHASAEHDAADGAAVLDAATLEDEEIANSIRQQFHDEVGDDLAGVQILCRRGCVTLTGEVASEELREVARLIVEDENGLQVSDRLLVSPIAGESPGETEKVERPLPNDVGIDEDEIDADDVTDNILEVEDEGIGFSAPSRPVPER
jgi:hypothetical protein